MLSRDSHRMVSKERGSAMDLRYAGTCQPGNRFFETIESRDYDK